MNEIPILEAALKRAYEEIADYEADNLRDMYIDCFGDEFDEDCDDEDDEDCEDEDNDKNDEGPVVTKEMIFDRWMLYVRFAEDKMVIIFKV